MVINLTPFLNFVVLSTLLFATFVLAQYLSYKVFVWQLKVMTEKSRKEADIQTENTAKMMIEAMNASKEIDNKNNEKH